MHSAGIKAAPFKSCTRERNGTDGSLPCCVNQRVPGGRHQHSASTEPLWMVKILLLLTDKCLASTEKLTSRCLSAGNSAGKRCLLGVCCDLLWDGNTAWKTNPCPSLRAHLRSHSLQFFLVCVLEQSKISRSVERWIHSGIQPHTPVCCCLAAFSLLDFRGQSKDTSVYDATKTF